MKEDFTQLTQSYQTLLAAHQSLLLSTASKQAIPDISYAPFVRDQDGFVIYVSELAKHTRNLLENPQASVMFIRHEAQTPNLFARERAIISCQAKEVSRTDSTYLHRLKHLQNEFGEVITLLSSLNDFHLFVLCPNSARYVVGFGRAFNINIADDTVTN